jgi:hypothetical protein
MSPAWRRVPGSDVPELAPDEPAEPAEQAAEPEPEPKPASKRKAPARRKTGPEKG